MRSPAGLTQSSIAAGSPPAGGGNLQGRPLLLARAGWISMTLLVVVLDALGVPVLYTHLLSACSGEAGADAACVPGALSPEQLRQLSVHGLSVQSYAGR